MRPSRFSWVECVRVTAGWAADRNDEQRSFYLTGDFKPIHALWPVAKRTR